MQYFPRVREPKSHNLLSHNGTVRYGRTSLREELGTAVPRYCLLDGTKFSTKFSLCVLQYTAVLNLDSIDLKTGLVQLRYYILCETK